MSSNNRFLIASLRLLPKNLYSRFIGFLAHLPLPRFARNLLIGTYARHFGCPVEDAERPMLEYGSLADFFTRHLKDGLRPVDPTPGIVTSPSDGRVLACGTIQAGRALQAKGRDYGVDELLGGHPWAERFEGGSFATVYLSPRDYHRVHTPATGRILGYVHVPGTLWPVNDAGVSHVDRLFCRNERLVTLLETDDLGPMAVIMIGATVVGRISVRYDDIVTNRIGRRASRRSYEPSKPIKRGDELGTFHMGSCVVLLVGRGGLGSALETGSAIKMGEPLLVAATET